MDKTIEKEGQVFWQALQDQLAVAVDSLPDEFMGSITSFDGGVRVTLNKLGMAFNQAYTDLFYRRGSAEIRCSALNGSPYVLHLSPTVDGKVGAKSTLGISVMTPHEASEHIIDLMLKNIGRK